MVDSSGPLLGVKVLPANQTDRTGGAALLSAVRNAFPCLQHIWADQGYKGQFQTWVKDALHLDLEVVYSWRRQLERYSPACTTNSTRA